MVGKFSGVLLCTDFDGTFAGPLAVVSEINCRAVRYFQENGGLFTIATGRSPDFLLKYAEMFSPNAPVIAMNGTMVCDLNGMRTIKEFTMDDDILDFIDFLFGTGLVEQVHFANDEGQYHVLPPGYAGRPSDFYRGIARPWYKILAAHRPEDGPELKRIARAEAGERYSLDSSYAAGVEVYARGGGKGECLKWMVENLNGKIRRTVAAGDYENDISLIVAADIGYAVGNALDEVKAAADRVTVSNAEDAIAKIIYEELEGII